MKWTAAMPLLLAAVALLAFPGRGEAGDIPEKTDAIPNYVLIRPGVAAAGQPSPEVLGRLKELGFQTVINLRTVGEPGFVDETAALQAQGLRYVHVPVTAATFSGADVAAVQAVLDDPQAGPVLIHCASANRVGALWAAMLAAKGKTLEEAEAEGRRVGLRSESMTAAVRRVAASRPAP
jgi:uncharacterized protein (TIGR01244 family)